MQRLYVDIPFQGRGIADALMKACLDEARKRGYQWLWLGVWEKNFKAQKYYRKQGFERFGEHVFMMGDDHQTDWLLKRKI